MTGAASTPDERLMHCLSGVTGSVLAGVSGGADSMALMLLLLEKRQRGDVRLAAVHVNHGLRGEASDGDEAFVRAFCKAHDVTLYTYRLTPPDNPGEAWAREARYAAFAKAMQASGADCLCLAHHRDDQTETLLMHLMRGSGLDGLCGMRRGSVMHGMRIVRPLLDASRAELAHYLEAHGQPWREDRTNAGDDYLRNRVRHQLTPLLEALAPGASARIAETAQLLLQDADVLQTQTADWLTAYPERRLPVAELLDMQEGMRSRILRAWWGREQGVTADASATRTLEALVQSPVGTRLSLPGGRSGYRGWRYVHLDGCGEPAPAHTVNGCGEYPMGGCTVVISGSLGHYGNGCLTQEMPEAMLDGCELRTRRTGDWISPFGMQGRQSLQDYFVNRHVDEPFRDSVPLLCKGSEVLFAIGVGAGALPRWHKEQKNVRITAGGKLPWAE